MVITKPPKDKTLINYMNFELNFAENGWIYDVI